MKLFEWLGEEYILEFPWEVWECGPAAGWNESLTAFYDPGRFRKFDLALGDNDWPVFSERLRRFLEKEVPGCIRFFPILLSHSDGSGEISGYCVGELLKVVDCIDRSQTISTNNWVLAGRNQSFQLQAPIILDPKPIGEERLFRVKGYSRPIVVTDDLKKAVQAGSFRRQIYTPMQTSIIAGKAKRP
jgi:hypothetical protein